MRTSPKFNTDRRPALDVVVVRSNSATHYCARVDKWRRHGMRHGPAENVPDAGTMTWHRNVQRQREFSRPQESDTLDYSAICGVARVVGIVTKSRSPDGSTSPLAATFNYGWVLADVKRLRKLIKCNGAFQLWNVPPNILRSIKRQLPKRIAAKINR